MDVDTRSDGAMHRGKMEQAEQEMIPIEVRFPIHETSTSTTKKSAKQMKKSLLKLTHAQSDSN